MSPITQQLFNKRGKPIIPTSSLHGMPVKNEEGDDLGILSELMIEMNRGTVAYAILKFEDKKSFALPYSMLRIDPENKTIQANVQREVFEHGRGIRTENTVDKGRQD